MAQTHISTDSNTRTETGTGIDKAESFRIFDRIHKRYDLLNRIFSFGQDVLWRRKVAKQIGEGSEQELLDLATGTGDVALTILKRRKDIKYAHGYDMSGNMLKLGKLKAEKRGMADSISFLQGDAGCLPFGENRFNAATMAFGIRNVVDPVEVLKEIRRVLKPGGTALILEFSLPKSKLIRGFHLFYLRRVIPHIGAIVSKDKHAYRYLNQTIETFPYGKDFCELMEKAGFKDVGFTPVTFGVATIYRGVKSS